MDGGAAVNQIFPVRIFELKTQVTGAAELQSVLASRCEGGCLQKRIGANLWKQLKLKFHKETEDNSLVAFQY